MEEGEEEPLKRRAESGEEIRLIDFKVYLNIDLSRDPNLCKFSLNNLFFWDCVIFT